MKAEEAKPQAKAKSAVILPNQNLSVGGTRTKPSLLPFATLRQMAKVPAIAAIINTRLNQVARFARRPRFDGDLGFRIGLKNPQQTMSKAAQARAFELEEFFLRTGSWDNPQRKDNFNSFLRKITRDTLTLDAMAWENVFTRAGNITDLFAVDAATIELLPNAPTSEIFLPAPYMPVTAQGYLEPIAYVQRVDGRITAEYTRHELSYGIRNPRTDVEYSDFGMSELETLVEIVTGIMNGVRYNTTYFSYNSLPQGVLEVIGKYEEEDIEAFTRHWKTLTDGAQGKWAVPVMGMEEGSGFKFTPFKSSNQDMQFNEFLEFLFNLAAAVYQIDPNEVGFKSWTSSTSMSQSDNTAEKMDSSKDKGFIPLMYFLSDSLNTNVLDVIAPEFALYWAGLDDESEDRKAERLKNDIDSGVLTIAEVRKQRGLEVPPDAKWMHAPANAVLIQAYMAEHQAATEEDSPDNPKKDDEEEPLQKSFELDITWEGY
ncbi:phage portal protein [Paenibacillus sp. 23TSA30-6]|uniref:phage portal protein n=1 Tax=Paenibacillus sp. 23TSA30-6 TaxID=2546104 RepID=UPI001787B091|nr:phage portal protein [Paenibacillus sp. 23TSA30-6]MBE0335106.1 phage portal protein [Paenibacillus sp. 23TSA30-6]